MNIPVQLAEELEGLPTKSAKIRRMSRAGIARADIARYLGLRYQHVRNVLVAEEAKAAARDPAPVFAALDSAGRLVVPAQMRRALGLGCGDSVLVTLEGGELRIQSRRRALEKARAALRAELSPGVSLVDELIADRRAEAASE
ncbi:MAG: AbrB/MazE/SpoVT family DNA-binding domain-containing protein [Oceanicaulis sp.]